MQFIASLVKLSYQLKDDVVILSPLEGQGQRNVNNKIVVTLINVERETASGVKFNYQAGGSDQYKKSMPAWQLNLYVLVSALFSDKQYEEGLQLLSGVLFYIQSNNTLSLNNLDQILTVEPVNMSFSELSNLWSICGGTYYPSVLCKIRMLNVDSNEIMKVARAINKEDIGL